MFLRLFSAVSRAWERDLRAHDQIDFEDMLNVATDCIESGRWASPYRIVMVDEMQDASITAIALKDRSQYDNAVLKYCMQLDAQLDSSATVLVLSRYSRGRDDVPSVLQAKFSRLTVDFNTVHVSKGKEADYVIVLGLESRGFPSVREDDPLLQLAMAVPDSFPHAEERRLFYVALTRARRSVLLLTRAGHESPFLIELIQARALQVRSSAGADITPVICPKCKKRIMRQRQGKRGPFLGCDGYPLCKGTIDVTSGYAPQGSRPSSGSHRTR